MDQYEQALYATAIRNKGKGRKNITQEGEGDSPRHGMPGEESTAKEQEPQLSQARGHEAKAVPLMRREVVRKTELRTATHRVKQKQSESTHILLSAVAPGSSRRPNSVNHITLKNVSPMGRIMRGPKGSGADHRLCCATQG